MDWKQLLADLRGRGWTQQLIAAHVQASQAAISDLNSGKTINPSYSVGRALVQLHESGAGPAKTEAKAA
jgi:predicted transcriptional regulator